MVTTLFKSVSMSAQTPEKAIIIKPYPIRQKARKTVIKKSDK